MNPIDDVVPAIDGNYYVRPEVTIALPEGTAGTGKLILQVKDPVTGSYTSYPGTEGYDTVTWTEGTSSIKLTDLQFEVPFSALPATRAAKIQMEYTYTDGTTGSLESEDFNLLIDSGDFLSDGFEYRYDSELHSLNLRFYLNDDTTTPVVLNTVKLNHISTVMININDSGTKRAVRLESIPNVFPMTEENIINVNYSVPFNVTVWSDEEDVIDSYEFIFSGLDENDNQITQTITNP